MVYKSDYVGQWKVGMFNTCCAAPCTFCFNCLCPHCGAYRQREQLLDMHSGPGTGKYFCCLGQFPICCLKDDCPRVPCLCLEVCFCLVCAVSSNRAHVQITRQLENSCCDTCLIWTTCICQCAICIFETLGHRCDPTVKNAVDFFYCTVIGCMLTQQDLEIDNSFQPPPKQQQMA